MSKLIITTLALAIASVAISAGANSTCCKTVERTVYENPKPKYPKDPRQHIVVKRKVPTVVCALTEKACLTQIPARGKAKEPTCRC